tara:strand:- start:885 stop:1397 length:513 start_codon:yes stop_codon:yes gene_type:complete
MDQYKEGIGNPFDAPVPGQSLTDTPGNYPWEHPPLYSDTGEAADYVWERLHKPEFAEQIIAMLDAGVPVEAIGRVIVFGGFLEGKFTPDVAFIITEPVLKMIIAMGIKADVKKFRLSLSDITNNKQMTSIIRLKEQGKELEKIAKGIKQDVKKVESKGLMAKPENEQEAE